MRIAWSEARSLKAARAVPAFLGLSETFSFWAVMADDVALYQGGASYAGYTGGYWLGILAGLGVSVLTALASAPAPEVYRRPKGARLGRGWCVRLPLALAVFVAVAILHRVLWDYWAARLYAVSGSIIYDNGGSTFLVAAMLALHSVLYRMPGEPADRRPARVLSGPEVRRATLPFAVGLLVVVSFVVIPALIGWSMGLSIDSDALQNLAAGGMIFGTVAGVATVAALGFGPATPPPSDGIRMRHEP